MRIRLIAGAVLGLVLLAGCSHDGAGSSGGDTAAAGPAVADRAALDSGGSAAGSGDKAATSALITSRALIRIANLTVEVERGTVSKQAVRADDIATDAGGSVFSDDRSSGSAQLTLKVPPDALGAVLGKLADLGEEKSRSLSTEDVTQKVADVDARVDSAQAAITRLRTLYASASKVGDVLAIEGELSDREADLESLQAQQRVLNSQTAQATIHVEFDAAAAPAPAKRHGVGGALASGWHAFTASAAWLTRALAASLPFLAVLAALALAGWQVWRRRFRTTPEPDPS